MANATFGAHRAADETLPLNPAAYVHPIGVAVSLAVFVGMIIWGISLFLRDAADIPVVQRLDGPMRIAPEDPGGIPAAHQGLSVNEVAGNQAIQGNELLTLAPLPVALETIDAPNDTEQQNSEITDNTPVVTPSAEITALAEQLAAVSTAVNDDAAPANAALPTIPAMRPRMRDASITAASVATPQTPVVVPPGTRMAQLGAYETRAIAEQEWARLSAKLGAYLGDKQHVIQTAKRDGIEFYRLRVIGFADRTEARQFCSALISQNADCYPTVMR